MKHVFVLGYSRAEQFFETYKPNPNIKYYFIDNGNQTFTAFDGCFVHHTSRNIGCAGGWNLIAYIAFDYFNLDKIVITQDDITLPDYLFQEALDEYEEGTILGIIQPFFEFSAFAISRQVYDKVGKFDESFKYVYGEDADYKHRCYLANVPVKSMYKSDTYNHSASIADDPSVNNLFANLDYLKEKWGVSVNKSLDAQMDNQPPYELYNPTKEMWYSKPSEEEYRHFLRKQIMKGL